MSKGGRGGAIYHATSPQTLAVARVDGRLAWQMLESFGFVLWLAL